MTQKEAFEFLELPESASNIEIKTRISDKLDYFDHLSEHAPSDFLRRINAQNAVKVKTLQQDFFPWTLIESGSEVLLPLEPGADEEQPEDELPLTVPIIISAGDPLPELAPAVKAPLAWLIKHTEHQEAMAIPLFAGKNYIGRKTQPGLEPFIAIDGDPYISRVQAVIFTEEGGGDKYYMLDSAAANNGSASRNGTYLNGNKKRITKKELLTENDTIQFGVTKFVLKINNKKIDELIEEVKNRTYTSTVSVD